MARTQNVKFNAIQLEHGERAPWDAITHVRIKANARADTDQGQRVLDHIRKDADRDGVAVIVRIQAGFPARKRLTGLRGMQIDLRHMAGNRNAGVSEQNKGLLELGWVK